MTVSVSPTPSASPVVKALQRIERWFGEFPETGLFWDKAKTEPMSYAAAFGSNGERDFMRSIAREALSALASLPSPEQPEGVVRTPTPAQVCDCERGHNGLGMAGRQCDCAASEEDDETCTGCYGTGWDAIAERFCHCADGHAARPSASAALPVSEGKSDAIFEILDKEEAALRKYRDEDCQGDDTVKRHAWTVADGRLAEVAVIRRKLTEAALSVQEPAPALEGREGEDTHAFKNFHRLLCERFDYTHDEKDWRRDQVSVIEWIAKRYEYSRSAATLLKRAAAYLEGSDPLTISGGESNVGLRANIAQFLALTPATNAGVQEPASNEGGER